MTCDPLTGLGVQVNFALLGESRSSETEVQSAGKVNICGALKHFMHTELSGMCSPLANELLQAMNIKQGSWRTLPQVAQVLKKEAVQCTS